MVAAGAADEVRAADAAGASATARKALGFEQLLAGDVDGHEARHAPLRQAASSPGCASCPGVQPDRRRPAATAADVAAEHRRALP